MNRETEKQGERDFYRGKDLKDNPYPRNSEQAKDWERGNNDAWDEYQDRHSEYFGRRT